MAAGKTQLWSQQPTRNWTPIEKGGNPCNLYCCPSGTHHLTEAGFRRKSPGLAGNAILKGCITKGLPVPKLCRQQVAIIGGGIQALQWAMRWLNAAYPFILEQADDVATAASGNPSGLLVPF